MNAVQALPRKFLSVLDSIDGQRIRARSLEMNSYFLYLFLVSYDLFYLHIYIYLKDATGNDEQGVNGRLFGA